MPGKTHSLHSEMGENVHWVGHDEDVSILAESGGLDAIENLHEKGDVPINEIEARFVRLAAKAGGDYKNVAVGGARVVAGVNLVVTCKSAAVIQVEGFA